MSDEHKILEKDVGTWDAEILVRPDPAKPPLPSKGVAVSRIVGGRWLVTDFTSEGGFEGHGVYGYDPAVGSFVSTWVDNTRTFLAIGKGAWDPETRTMTYVTQATLPDGRLLAWREETTSVDDDTRKFRQLFLTPAGEIESMIAVYRKRSGN